MSLPTNNKKDGKLANSNQKNNGQNSKFISKPSGKSATVSKKPIKTGGSRGS